jgi:hypothetical protein
VERAAVRVANPSAIAQVSRIARGPSGLRDIQFT